MSAVRELLRTITYALGRPGSEGGVHVVRDNPTRSLRDARRLARQFLRTGKKTAVLIGFSHWKTFMVDYLPDYNVVFLGHRGHISPSMASTIWDFPNPEVFVWGRNYSPDVRRLCEERGIVFTFVEDGFLRGLGLGVAKSRPVSLCMDRQALHFDRSNVSDLETLLATYDFAADPSLMASAEKVRELIVQGNLTKYNNVTVPEGASEPSDSGYILVLGQVEDDASIALGMANPMTNNALFMRAAGENPGHRILFRPHPEVAVVSKPHYSDPNHVSHLCEIGRSDQSLGGALAGASRVYTMTSLAGFEAALRGLPVRVFGTPFYAGWGFTDDVEPVPRRVRRLSPLEVLAGAYLLYPKYFDPITSEHTLPLAAVNTLVRDLETAAAVHHAIRRVERRGCSQS